MYRNLALIIVGFVIMFGLASTAKAYEPTTCPDWAHFGLSIAFKHRDTGTAQAIVRRAVMTVMQNDPEMITALKYVDYVYANTQLTPVQAGIGVYDMCVAKGTL